MSLQVYWIFWVYILYICWIKLWVYIYSHYIAYWWSSQIDGLEGMICYFKTPFKFFFAPLKCELSVLRDGHQGFRQFDCILSGKSHDVPGLSRCHLKDGTDWAEALSFMLMGRRNERRSLLISSNGVLIWVINSVLCGCPGSGLVSSLPLPTKQEKVARWAYGWMTCTAAGGLLAGNN